MKRLSLSIIGLLSSAVAAPAAIVAINNSVSNADSGNFHFADSSTTVRLKDSKGALLPAGTVARAGYFLNYSNSLDTAIATSSFSTLTSALNPNRFVPIGVGGGSVGDDQTANMMIRDLSGTLRFITSVTLNYVDGTANTEAAGLTRGTKLFVFLLNQNAFSGSPTEWGIFSADNWVVPATGTATLTLALKEVDTPSEVFRGKLGSLGTVPEPSISVLALGSLFLASRRRR